MFFKHNYISGVLHTLIIYESNFFLITEAIFLAVQRCIIIKTTLAENEEENMMPFRM